MPDAFDVSLFRPFYSHNKGALVPGLHPTPRSLSWPDLVDGLAPGRPPVVDVDDKTSLWAWSPARFQPRALRSADSVVALSCLVLDYDDGTPLRDARLAWWDWTHLVHTSWSHTREAPRFRLVVPLARPVPALLWGRLWSWAADRSAGAPDGACKDPCRVYFVPAVREVAWPYFADVHERDWLDVDPQKLPLSADERADMEARERRAAMAARLAGDRPSTPGAARRRLGDLLKCSGDLRAMAGDALRGRVRGGRVSGVCCPGCGKRSVWWPIEPRGTPKALCSHRNTCGWTGWLDELLEAAGALEQVAGVAA